MMIKVLYLSYDGMTDPLGQSQVIPYLAGLSMKGYQFTLISFEKQKRFLESKQHIEQQLEKHKIQWIPLFYHKKPPILSTLYDLYFLKKTVWHLCKQHKFQIIHCRSYLTALVGMQIKKKLGIKFIFDMRGFWADERVEGEIWNIRNLLYKAIFQYFKKKEKELLSTADYTITLTHKAKEIIHSWQGIVHQPIPIQVIPCCVDTDLFDPQKLDKAEQNRLREGLGIKEDQFVLTYLGSLGTWYMVEDMITFFQHLLHRYPSAVFLFITQDDEKIVRQYTQQFQIPDSQVIITSSPREKVPLYLSLSTASIFFIKPVFSKQASSATKMGEIMSMGIPLITNSGIGDSDLVIQESRCGVITSLGDYVDIVENMERLLSLSSEDIRSAANEYYSLEKGILRYNRIYHKLTKDISL